MHADEESERGESGHVHVSGRGHERRRTVKELLCERGHPFSRYNIPRRLAAAAHASRVMAGARPLCPTALHTRGQAIFASSSRRLRRHKRVNDGTTPASVGLLHKPRQKRLRQADGGASGGASTFRASGVEDCTSRST